MNPINHTDEQYRPTLLDVPISFYDSGHANVPSQQTTLRRISTTDYYKPIIEQIRAEEDATKQGELKNQLPAISPVSLMYHRRCKTSFAQKIKQQWPLLVGDIDRKDNPGVDMAQLKTHLARLPYILLCGYSVRGGLWFVVRVPDHQTPDTLAAHFRYVYKLFRERLDIKLDKSKGGNPTDLRFVSYDAAPYINEAATVMNGTYTPEKPKSHPVDYSRSNSQDEEQLVTRLVRFAETATEGNRHLILLKAAIVAGGYVAAQRIDEQTAIYALETVASEWPMFSKSQKTIRDGILYGTSRPLPDVR